MKCPKCGNTETNSNGDCSYCSWKGDVGPGAELKEIVKEQYVPIPGECESCPSNPECKGELAEGSMCGQSKPTIDLSNVDGNAFHLIGLTSQTLRRAGYTKNQVNKFKKEAMSGDYDNVLQTINNWCEVI